MLRHVPCRAAQDMKAQFVLTLAVLAAAAPRNAVAQTAFTTPLGIPTPSFGITQVARQQPSNWATATPGFYYVDATLSAATDLSNPYGTRAKPRRTIPTSLPAGAVVELHGTYSTYHGSPATIVSAGTASAPVFIRGVGATSRPTATSCWELAGSYYVVENIRFAGCGSVVLLAPTNRGALRHSEVQGNVSGGGVGIVSWTGGSIND